MICNFWFLLSIEVAFVNQPKSNFFLLFRLNSNLSEKDRNELCVALDSVMAGKSVVADVSAGTASFLKLHRLVLANNITLNEHLNDLLDPNALPQTPKSSFLSRNFSVTPGPPTPLSPIEQASLCFTPEHTPKPNFNDLSPDLFDWRFFRIILCILHTCFVASAKRHTSYMNIRVLSYLVFFFCILMDKKWKRCISVFCSHYKSRREHNA